MNWYLAKMVFNIDIENGAHNRQFDEQLRMIKAESADAAFFKARALGKQEEGVFLNSTQKQVSWKFIDVSELHQFDELTDGSEIYSSTHETDEANTYISFVKHKAVQIQTKSQVFV